MLSVLERDLSDSAVNEISSDTRLGLAYNAALKAAAIALAASGYRAARDNHHFRTLQSLSETIGANAKEVAKLDAFRKKRNVSDYDRAGTTTEAEVKELTEMALDLKNRVIAWLKKNHPELLEAPKVEGSGLGR